MAAAVAEGSMAWPRGGSDLWYNSSARSASTANESREARPAIF